MSEMKKKALGGIQSMLEDRMSNRMKPKVAEVEAEVPVEGEEVADRVEGEETKPIQEQVEEGDMNKLSPEEQSQLQMLLEKMGC